MSIVSASALKLAGFLVAHAFSIISDLEPDEAYVPQAICTEGKQRRLFVFEADTQVEAVAKGKAFMAQSTGSFDSCAFARDGQIRRSDDYLDVLLIDIVERDTAHLTILQPYRKHGKRELKLIGDEYLMAAAGGPKPDPELAGLVRQGALEHEYARDTWTSLNSQRGEAEDPFR